MYAGEKRKTPLFSFCQHYFCTFVAYNKAQMDINQNYREAVKTIKEAILRSQYRAAASVNNSYLFITASDVMCRKIPVQAFGGKVQLNRYLLCCKKNCRG